MAGNETYAEGQGEKTSPQGDPTNHNTAENHDQQPGTLIEAPELIELEVLGISIQDQQRMSENVELPGEVVDRYHFRPFIPTGKKLDKQQAAPDQQNTPTKLTQPQASVRRSPRHHRDNEALSFVIIRLVLTDLEGVDPRLDIPKLLILAHGEQEQCQSVQDLLECLTDQSDKRLKHQFDLCEWSTL